VGVLLLPAWLAAKPHLKGSDIAVLCSSVRGVDSEGDLSKVRSPVLTSSLGLESCKSSLEQLIERFNGALGLRMVRPSINNVDIVSVA